MVEPRGSVPANRLAKVQVHPTVMDHKMTKMALLKARAETIEKVEAETAEMEVTTTTMTVVTQTTGL